MQKNKMNIKEIIDNKELEWDRMNPADESAVQSLIKQANIEFPENYLTFLRFCNGGEGELGINVQGLEELLVKMLIQRDYFIDSPWRIFIFDDRIEMINPGTLPNNLTVENIRHGISNIRNPLIASLATKELPYRGLGTGIRRAISVIPRLELVSSYDLNHFSVVIPRPVE